jgi:hypothetical protein
LANGWGRTDPAAAVQWAQTELQGLVRLRAMAEAIPRDYVSRHPEEVIAWFREIPEFRHVFSERGDLDGTRAFISQGDLDFGREELDGSPLAGDIFRQALLRVAETDPGGALAAAAGAGEDSFAPSEGTLRGRIAGEWAAREPERALQWLAEQSEAVQRGVAHSAEFERAFAEMDPGALRGAVMTASGLEGERQRAVYRAMLGGVTQRAPDEALRLLDSLPPESLAQVIGPLMSLLTESHPWRAVEELHRVSDEQRVFYETKIATMAARDSAAEAMGFVEGLPEERRIEQMYEAILPEWISQDWDAARDWYLRLPEGEGRDWSLRTIELERFVRDEAAAQETLVRLAAIDEPAERQYALSDFFGAWRERDAEAARNGLEAAELPDWLKNRLRHEMK